MSGWKYCACGCGELVVEQLDMFSQPERDVGGRPRLYVNATHRKRASRSRLRDTRDVVSRNPGAR